MPTLGLALITNEFEETEKLIERYYPFFDTFFITVADKDKTIYDKLAENKKDKVELSYFKWVDHFGKARLYNQSQVTTDYWFWMDTDDEITNPEKLREIVAGMVQNNIDVMFMNYDYFQDAGEQRANHWRERIIRTASEHKWEDVPCHETVPARELSSNTDLCSVKHHKTIDHMLVAMDRNQKLLEKDWEKQKDPRTAYYLGMTYQYHKFYDRARDMFNYLIKNGGWDEQKVIAWSYVAEGYEFEQEHDKALDATDQAMRLDPSHPDAYYHKIMIYTNLREFDKAVEWSEVAVTKHIKPDTMQLVDPTKYTYRGLFLAAQAHLYLGNVEKAYQLYKSVADIAPHFVQELTQSSGVNWDMTFNEAYNEFNAIGAVKFLSNYLKDRDGKLEYLFKALQPKLSYDNLLMPERQIAIPPKQWPDRTIVIYCGQGFEPWGPDTLDKGMGGSEEAWVYLSRELAALGWDVTVFCEREGPLDDKNMHYRSWTEFSPYDTFDVFVAWRRPEYTSNIKARKKLVDLHDTIDEKALVEFVDSVDMFMVKSDYHRTLYPQIPDNKISIVTNGIFRGLAYAV